MNSLQSGLINLINSALTGEAHQLPKDFDLHMAVDVANKHKIVPMVYYGALLCGVEKKEPLMHQMFVSTCQNVSISTHQMYQLKNIFDRFDGAKIDYMPLKGILLKGMYPKPEMRSMGDGDILIKPEQYDKIRDIMVELGFAERYESDHELVWYKAPLTVELHKRLIPSYDKDYYEYFQDGWQLANRCEGTRYSMTDEDEMIYLFTHFAKHYRAAGIGIKHLVDLWVFRQNRPNLNEEYVVAALRKLKLDEFYNNINKTLSVWFEGKSPTDKTEFITQIIFNSGAFGSAQSKILAKAIVQNGGEKSSFGMKAKMILQTFFLPFRQMCQQFPILHKLPFLLPILWPVRIVKLLCKKGRFTQYKKELDKVTKKKVIGYQQSLNFVGLDFNYKE